MRRRIWTSALALASLVMAAPTAEAHLVQPGESLWSIAQANGVSVGSLAAANGLGAQSQIVSGTTLNVPVGASTGVAAQSQSSTGGRVVQPGETLSSVAAANGISISALAAANGLSTTSWLTAGKAISIPGASSAATSTATQAATNYATTTAGNVPVPTAERVTATQVGDVAQSYGMSRTLLQAIGWQESGFNNAALSSANARGVMQIIPPTWQFINKNLAGGTLNPASAHDNIAAGSLYLRYLYRLKGGDPAATIASYYQGPGRTTMLPDTKQYVNNVQQFQSWYRANPK
jgi:soluble lytic murein transglycosylase-like protein